jgi:large subunit ribosomal protein L24
MKILSGDTVQVISGKDKGKTGVVLKSIAGKNLTKKGSNVPTISVSDKILIKGVNIIKKAVKRDVSESGFSEYEKPVLVNKVKLLCPSCKKPARVGYKIVSGKKSRVCKLCDKVITK